MGEQVARVMGWRHCVPKNLAHEAEIPRHDVVISRPSEYGSENSRGRDFDGLTVRVDDVCDLISNAQKNAQRNVQKTTYQERDSRSLQIECLRQVMRELERKGGRS
jgi:hypothetical protein